LDRLDEKNGFGLSLLLFEAVKLNFEF
jgi:hypothetical protein